MNVLSGLSLMALLGLCVSASYTDLRYGLVRNDLLASHAVLAIILFAVTCVKDPHVLMVYMPSVVISLAIILSLFYFHVWAGGDAKFACVATMLYPVSLYPFPNVPLLSVMVALAFAFVYGVAFVVVRSLCRLLIRSELPDCEQMVTLIIRLIWSCTCSYALITLYHVVYRFVLSPHISLDEHIVSALGFCLAWLAAQRQILKNRWVLSVVILADLAGCVALHTMPLNMRSYNMVLVLALALSRTLIENNKYQAKAAHDIERGDILSVESAVFLSTLMRLDEPLPATEDLRSRLTEDQASRVREWGGDVSVVEKTPFVIFIALGYITCLIWGMMQL